jgi:hypothetical protein
MTQVELNALIDESRRPKPPFPVLIILTGIAIIVAMLVPVLFEFTEVALSRRRHTGLKRAALMTGVVTIIVGITWSAIRRRFPPKFETATPSNRRQFSTFDLIVFTTFVAAFMAVSKIMSWKVASSLIIAVSLAMGIWSCWQSASTRTHIFSLLACLFLPFLWIVPFNKPFGHTSGMYEGFTIGPSLIPVVFVMRDNNDAGSAVAAMWVIGELLLGAWLARRAGWKSLIYIVGILGLSSINSFFLYALSRS